MSRTPLYPLPPELHYDQTQTLSAPKFPEPSFSPPEKSVPSVPRSSKSKGSAIHAAHRTALGNAYQARSLATDVATNPADIERAIVLKEKAIAAAPENSPVQAEHLSALGDLLYTRFQADATETNPEDIDRAISLKEKAAELLPADAPDKAGVLASLGNALLTRFESDVTDIIPEDINRAVTLKDQAAKLVPIHTPEKADILVSLSSALQARFEADATDTVPEDIDRAIALIEHDLAPDAISMSTSPSPRNYSKTTPVALPIPSIPARSIPESQSPLQAGRHEVASPWTIPDKRDTYNKQMNSSLSVPGSHALTARALPRPLPRALPLDIANQKCDTGEVYSGQWLQLTPTTGCAHGWGKIEGPDYRYEGQWMNGKKHGMGNLSTTQPRSEYEGGWLSDKRHGFGRQSFVLEGAGEIVYEGGWKEDQRYGWGTMKNASGSEVYTGGFFDGIENGWANFRMPDGSVFEGGIKDGQATGYGIGKLMDGSYVDGAWEKGKAHGCGTELDAPSQIKHIGSFQDGLWDGYGIDYIGPDEVRKGIWKKGEFVMENLTIDDTSVSESPGLDSPPLQFRFGRKFAYPKFKVQPTQFPTSLGLHQIATPKTETGPVETLVSDDVPTLFPEAEAPASDPSPDQTEMDFGDLLKVLQNTETLPDPLTARRFAQILISDGKIEKALTILWPLAERFPQDLGILLELFDASRLKYGSKPKGPFFGSYVFIMFLYGITWLSQKCRDWGIGEIDWWPLASEDDLKMVQPYMARAPWWVCSSGDFSDR
jgi:hypothetical protein